MCSFHSFFIFFFPLFLLNKDMVSSPQPAVTTVSVPVWIPAYIIRIWVSLERKNQKFTKPGRGELCTHQSIHVRTLSAWRAVAGMDPASPISSMILQPAPQPHPPLTAGQSRVQREVPEWWGSEDGTDVQCMSEKYPWEIAWKDPTLCTQSLMGLKREKLCSYLLLVQKPQHFSYTAYKYPNTWHVPWPEPQWGEAHGPPRCGKTFNLSHHQPWKGQEEGHGIFRNSLSVYPTSLVGITAPWCTHPSGSSEDCCDTHPALVVGALRTASSMQN